MKPESTRWSWILAGRDPDSSRYDEAWNHLYATYRPLVEAYFRKHARDASLARDWSDEFLARWVEGSLDGADPARGSFRRYLLVALRNFRYGQQRQRKGRWFSLDRPIPDAESADAERWFNRQWAHHVVDLTLRRLEAYQQALIARGASGRPYDLLRARYLEGGTPSLTELGTRFGLSTKAVERGLAKAREKLRGWLLIELRDTAGGEEELASERALLLAHGPEALARWAVG